MKSPYKLKQEIESKLFHGVVIPTAETKGYDMGNQREIVAMMHALAKKYHSMTKVDRQALIRMAEKNIETKVSSLKGKDGQTT